LFINILQYLMLPHETVIHIKVLKIYLVFNSPMVDPQTIVNG